MADGATPTVLNPEVVKSATANKQGYHSFQFGGFGFRGDLMAGASGRT